MQSYGSNNSEDCLKNWKSIWFSFVGEGRTSQLNSGSEILVEKTTTKNCGCTKEIAGEKVDNELRNSAVLD